MDNYIDPLKLSGFIALAITLALWAWLKWHSVPVERKSKFGCILKNDCPRLHICKKDGKKRCAMRLWRKHPNFARVSWTVMFPFYLAWCVVVWLRRPFGSRFPLGVATEKWWAYPPTKEEMALPIKDGVDL